MTIKEMKDILYKKLQDEQCYFKKSDISIKKEKNYYIITIKDYEHIPFKMWLENDDYFGYIVTINEMLDFENIVFLDNKKEYDIKTALIYLGYYIGTHF